MSCAIAPSSSNMPGSKIAQTSVGYLRRDPSNIIKTLDMKIADLVKSHLMFAVREEVEVLKEQIKDLLEKIGQLEHENRVLKDNASQETLSKLTMPKPQPPSSSS